jgi:hypothetical protein
MNSQPYNLPQPPTNNIDAMADLIRENQSYRDGRRVIACHHYKQSNNLGRAAARLRSHLGWDPVEIEVALQNNLPREADQRWSQALTRALSNLIHALCASPALARTVHALVRSR